MSDTVRWVIIIVAVVLVLGLVAFARGRVSTGAATTSVHSTRAPAPSPSPRASCLIRGTEAISGWCLLGPMREVPDEQRDDVGTRATDRNREEATFHPSLRLHDPVRTHRPRRHRHLDRPCRRLRRHRGGRADPGHLPRGGVEPAADPRRLDHRSDQRPLRDRGRDREHQLLQQRDALRCHRRRPLHHRDRRLPRRHHEDRGDPGGDRQAGGEAAGPGEVDDPAPDDRLRHRGHHLRNGGGEPRLLSRW